MTSERHLSTIPVGEALDAIDLPTVIAGALPCSWSIPIPGHPYADECFHLRHGEGEGVCWDLAHKVADAVRAALLG
jgi:hypothetical protein